MPGVGRSYGGILGLIAFLTALVRGEGSGGGAADTLPYACVSLVLFTALGFIFGCLAQRMVDDAVREQLVARMAADKKSNLPVPADRGG